MQKSTLKRILPSKLFRTIIVVSVVLCSLGLYAGFTKLVMTDIMPSKVHIDGIDVGGMKVEKCKDVLSSSNEKKLNSIHIPIQTDDGLTVFDSKMLGVSLNTDQIIEKVSKIGKDKHKSLLKNYKSILSAKKEYNSEFVINQDVMEKSIDSFLSSNHSQLSPLDKDWVLKAVTDAVYSGGQKKISISDIDSQKKNAILKDLPEGNELLSEYTTQSKEEENRDINLKVFCEQLDGYMIQPQETLSINDYVGEMTEEKGYRNGPVLVNQSQLQSDIGGGVCQVVTTLYNAALLANMEIVSRTKHSMPMDYVPVGMDATLNWPDIDFKIKNTSDTPIYIYAKSDKGTVNVSLYGMPLPEGAAIKIVPEVNEEIEPGNEEIIRTQDLPAGEKKVEQEAQTGYDVDVYREHYIHDTLEDRELISQDVYQPINKIVLVGSSSENK